MREMNQNLKDLLFFPTIFFCSFVLLLFLVNIGQLIGSSIVDGYFTISKKLTSIRLEKTNGGKDLNVGGQRVFLCPDDYTDFESQRHDFELWTEMFYRQNPEANLVDFANAREQFYIEFGCTEALNRMKYGAEDDIEAKAVEMIGEVVNKAVLEHAVDNN